jgi:ribosomal protein S18 acetylase RimI-like enzyme
VPVVSVTADGTAPLRRDWSDIGRRGRRLFVGFIAGWIVEEQSMTETSDSRRAGYVSDICIMPAHRGCRIASDLLFAIERHFAGAGITRVRIASLVANASAQAAYRHRQGQSQRSCALSTAFT